MNNSHDFLLEKRLREEAPVLHKRVTDSVLVLQKKMLEAFYTCFPNNTAHPYCTAWMCCIIVTNC